MTLLQAFTCWLIANELSVIALIEREQRNRPRRPEGQ